MNKNLKPLPEFRTEAEERLFWEANDSSSHVDWSKAERVRLPNLKPSTTSISLRLPVSLLDISVPDQGMASRESWDYLIGRH